MNSKRLVQVHAASKDLEAIVAKRCQPVSWLFFKDTTPSLVTNANDLGHTQAWNREQPVPQGATTPEHPNREAPTAPASRVRVTTPAKSNADHPL
jgi:hypothetical protein